MFRPFATTAGRCATAILVLGPPSAHRLLRALVRKRHDGALRRDRQIPIRPDRYLVCEYGLNVVIESNIGSATSVRARNDSALNLEARNDQSKLQ